MKEEIKRILVEFKDGDSTRLKPKEVLDLCNMLRATLLLEEGLISDQKYSELIEFSDKTSVNKLI